MKISLMNMPGLAICFVDWGNEFVVLEKNTICSDATLLSSAIFCRTAVKRLGIYLDENDFIIESSSLPGGCLKDSSGKGVYNRVKGGSFTLDSQPICSKGYYTLATGMSCRNGQYRG